MTATTFSPKDPEEDIHYGIDFSYLLDEAETISSATASMRVVSGTDSAPADMLSGSPIINGGQVSHKVIGGIAGCTYLFSLHVLTSAGQGFIESAPIKVIERD
jgi:hypothetical protein